MEAWRASGCCVALAFASHRVPEPIYCCIRHCFACSRPSSLLPLFLVMMHVLSFDLCGFAFGYLCTLEIGYMCTLILQHVNAEYKRFRLMCYTLTAGSGQYLMCVRYNVSISWDSCWPATVHRVRIWKLGHSCPCSSRAEVSLALPLLPIPRRNG